MVEFKCEKCNKNFNKKSTYINHTTHKKNSCMPKNINDINIEITNNPSNNSSNNSSNNPSNNLLNQNINIEEKKYVCHFCFKEYTRQDNLKRHISNKRCEILKLQIQQKENIFINLVKEDELNKSANNKLNKLEEISNIKLDNKQIVKNLKVSKLIKELTEMKIELGKNIKEYKNKIELEEEKKRIESIKILELERNYIELQKQNYKLQNKMNNIVNKNKVKVNKSIKNYCNTTTNSNNTQHITNNVVMNIPVIKLVDFGNEKLDKISYKVFIDTIKTQGASLCNKAIEGIHFNSDHPENQNIYISDFNRDKVMIYKNEKWIIDNWDTIFPELLEKVIQFGYDKEQFLRDCDYKTDGKKFNQQMIKNGMRWYKLLSGEELDVEYFELEPKDRPVIDKETYQDYLEMQEFRKKHPKKQLENHIKNKMKLNIYNKREIPIENFKKITNRDNNFNNTTAIS